MLNIQKIPTLPIHSVSHSTLVNADCFDVFPFIEDKSIDAIICDLPEKRLAPYLAQTVLF